MFVIIAVADLWTHGQADKVVCMTPAQYPLIVGVVVAVSTGLEKGAWTSGAWMLQSVMSSGGRSEKMHLTTVNCVWKRLWFSQRKMGCFMTTTGFWICPQIFG